MDPETSALLGDLIRGRSVAALATLHDGQPAASLIPYAAHVNAAGRLQLITHVSELSSHTLDMLGHPQVCLLITAPETAAIPPQATPRVSLPARARFVDIGHPDHHVLALVYLERFPQAVDWFSFGDFSIVALEPTGGRLVAGFARAMNVTPAALAAAFSGS